MKSSGMWSETERETEERKFKIRNISLLLFLLRYKGWSIKGSVLNFKYYNIYKLIQANWFIGLCQHKSQKIAQLEESEIGLLMGLLLGHFDLRFQWHVLGSVVNY